MKLAVIFATLLTSSVLMATGVEQFITTGWGVHASLENVRAVPCFESRNADNDDGLDTISSITKTFALPFQSVTVQLNSISWNVFDSAGTFLYQTQTQRDNAVSLAKSFTFRELQGFTVRITAQTNINGLTYTLDAIDFNLVGSGSIDLPTGVSPAFIDAYKTIADNWNTCYLRDLPLSRPRMLIISHTQLQPYQADFIKWKRQLGFEVYVTYKNEIGTTLNQFQAYIANHYNQYQCDYLLLFGDVGDPSATYTIPTSYFPSPEYQENDADDQQYGMILGDDYFPEMLVGRFSFGNVMEFITMVNKNISYEQAPYMDDTSWMQRALTVAGNYAEGELRPVTPVQMSRWLRDRLLNFGYAEVDTVYYPDTYPGTALIQGYISRGVQYVSYRGWGDANGWHYPVFHIGDLNRTFNDEMMPVVFSIVCNTGDFANTVNPSFGEKWMRMGTAAIPGGCIAFVGPSDLHTKTRLNNSVSSGAFRSILDYGVRGFGSSVLNGKMELYKTFPNDLDTDQYVCFYFHVYSVLSDPSLNMWTLVPNSIPESVIQDSETFSQSSSSLRIEAGNLNGASVTGTRNGTDFTYTTVQNGFAILPVDPLQTSDLTITVAKPNYIPLVKTLSPAPASLALIANDLSDALINPNTSRLMTLQVKNMSGSPMSAIQLNLSSPDTDAVSIPSPQLQIASLAPGASSTLEFSLQFSGQISPRQRILFNLESTNPSTLSSFQLIAGGAEFAVLSHNGTMALGQNNQIGFQLKNTGTQDLSGVVVTIHSLVNAMQIPNPSQSIGNWAIGESKDLTFNLQLASDVFEGRYLPLYFQITGSPEYTSLARYALTAGTPSSNDPTGPCNYGYFAYDSTDLGYSQSPVYNWVEIDPLEPDYIGQASVFAAQDDSSRVLQLPFNFRYFGQTYDQITICTNGWLSFGATDMEDFYNCYIPAALGPKAMIAGYWDDLKGLKTGTAGGGVFDDMRLCYWYDEPNNRYIVEWNKAYNQYTIDMMQDASLEKFQIILYPQSGRDGDILVQYHTVDNPGITTNFCTVGIEDHLALDGVTYTHGNQYPITAMPLQAGLAIKYTTIPPDNYVGNNDPVLPVQITLGQNFPNPFNPSTTIEFQADKPGKARLVILNLRGQIVRTLLNGSVSAGKSTLVWDGMDDKGQTVGTGLYLYRLQMNGKSETKRMLLLK